MKLQFRFHTSSLTATLQVFLTSLTRSNINKKEELTYATASAFCTGFQDRVTVLLYDGGLWKRSCNGETKKKEENKPNQLEDRTQQSANYILFIWFINWPQNISNLVWFIKLDRLTPYLDEDVDVVCDLEGHHFDLVLIT